VSLRFGYVSNGLRDHRLEDALDLLADNGYAGIALTLDHVHLDPLGDDLRSCAAAIRPLLEARGLRCVVETGARFALDPRRKHFPSLLSEGRERRIALLCAAVDAAVELGAPVVSLWSGVKPPELAREVAWQLLVDGVGRVLERAVAAGVVLGFEPEPGMLVERLDDYDALVAALGAPDALGLTLDIGHCVCLERQSVPDCIQRAAPRLLHVHVEDMRRGVHEHLRFGEGELDLPATLTALERARFTGLVAVELSRHSHMAHEVVPEAMAHLRAHMLEAAWV